MAPTYTLTSTQSRKVQRPQIFRLVGSEPSSKINIKSSQYIPRSSVTNLINFAVRPKGKPHVEHTSFDSAPISLALYTHSLPNNGRLRDWLERRYYQYEVTWGLYVLTTSEKIIINGLVLMMLSLIVYGITRVDLIQQVVGIMIKTVEFLLRGRLTSMQDLSDFLMHIASGQMTEPEVLDRIHTSMTVVKQIQMTSPTLGPPEI